MMPGEHGRALAMLAHVAELYVGEPVKVWIMPATAKALGNADYTSDGWAVGLRSDLWRDPPELGFTFLHEVAHVVLGHVPRKVIETERYDVNEIEAAAGRSEGLSAGLLKLLALQVRLNEQKADDWARAELARLDARIRGQTFAEALAGLD